jgi:hypothetical protein
MKRCIFCDCEAKLTAEHLRSQWINKLLSERTHRYVISHRDRPGAPMKQWETQSFDLKAKVVCAQCNNGWISDLENKEGKPLLKDLIRHDAPVTFLPRGVRSLASFAMKSAFIADCINVDREPFFDAATRKAFAATLRPPDGMHMWVCCLKQPRGKRHGIYKTRYGRPRSVVKDSVEVFVFTFSIECLLLQIAYVRWLHPSRDKTALPKLSQEARLDSLSIAFWPPNFLNGVVTWPPERHLPSDHAEMFADRFGKVNILH